MAKSKVNNVSKEEIAINLIALRYNKKFFTLSNFTRGIYDIEMKKTSSSPEYNKVLRMNKFLKEIGVYELIKELHISKKKIYYYEERERYDNKIRLGMSESSLQTDKLIKSYFSGENN